MVLNLITMCALNGVAKSIKNFEKSLSDFEEDYDEDYLYEDDDNPTDDYYDDCNDYLYEDNYDLDDIEDYDDDF